MTRRAGSAKAAIVGVVVVLVATVASACTHEYPSISREQVPQVVLDFTDGFAPEGKSPDDLDIVWRVCTPKDGRLIVACTYNRSADQKKPILFIASFPVDASGEVGSFDGHAVGVDFSNAVATQGGTTTGSAQAKDGTSYLKLDAAGVCLNPKLAKVVGTTSDGTSAETTPTDGYWFMSINDIRSVDKWTKIVGYDANGKVVQDFSFF